MFKIIISSNNQNRRIDKFLSERLKDYSRTILQKAIKRGLVLVNQKSVSISYLLKGKDCLEIDLEKIKKDSPTALVPSTLKLENLYENDDFLIIDKPVGIIVHPTASQKNNTLVNALISYFPSIENVGENKLRPGIVHRLDKDASGLLVVAKNQTSFEYFKEQFQKHLIKKEYLVLVHKKVQEPEGKIDLPIFRSKKGLKMTTSYGKKEKQAITEFKVLKYYFDQQLKQEYTLLKVRTKTGRTHQIRVHFKSIGHPLVGDKIYRIKRIKQPELNRIFLHACKLGFFDLKNKWQEFNLDLPPELKNFLKKL